VALLWATPARADNSFIVRSTLSLQALQTACHPLLLAPILQCGSRLGDPLGQLFLITSPLDLTGLLNLVGNPLGILDAEVDQLLNLVGPILVPASIFRHAHVDRASVPYWRDECMEQLRQSNGRPGSWRCKNAQKSSV